MPVVETVAIKDAGVEILLATIDGLLAARAGDKQKARERRMRRLIAQAAGRLVHDRMRDHTGGEMERLIKAAALGRNRHHGSRAAGAQDQSAERVARSPDARRRGPPGGAAGENAAAEERAFERSVAVNAAAAETRDLAGRV